MSAPTDADDWDDLLASLFDDLTATDTSPSENHGPLLGLPFPLENDESAPVVCSRCSTSFEPARIQLAPRTVAYGCSSFAHTTGQVSVAFGSPNYELHTLTYTDLDKTPRGIICDGCITVLIASGVFVDHP